VHCVSYGIKPGVLSFWNWILSILISGKEAYMDRHNRFVSEAFEIAYMEDLKALACPGHNLDSDSQRSTAF